MQSLGACICHGMAGFGFLVSDPRGNQQMRHKWKPVRRSKTDLWTKQKYSFKKYWWTYLVTLNRFLGHLLHHLEVQRASGMGLGVFWLNIHRGQVGMGYECYPFPHLFLEISKMPWHQVHDGRGSISDGNFITILL